MNEPRPPDPAGSVGGPTERFLPVLDSSTVRTSDGVRFGITDSSDAVPAGEDLRSYAAIGDGRTVALIARSGSIDWLPIPDLDSPPAFAALLDDQDGGRFELAPDLDALGPAAAEQVSVHREYVSGTNVLQSTWRCPTGTVRVIDALNSGVAGRLPWMELARRVDGLTGEVAMRWRIAPGTALGSAAPWSYGTPHGSVLRLNGLTMAPRTLGEMDTTVSSQHVAGSFRTAPGSRHLVGLVATEDEPVHLPDPADVDDRVDRTVTSWQDWAQQCRLSGPYADAGLRSALALKLLIHSPTGAVAAAATTSLPESREHGKNWDYRYAWVRDTAYTLDVLFRFGLREETHAAVSWLLRTIRRHGPDLSVFYRLNGELPGEHREADVPGWRGIGPVVLGNAAAGQLQLGVFGDLFEIARLYVVNGNLLDAQTGRLLAQIADTTCDLWQRRDAGMWELPQERQYVSSKLGCWQALRCAAELADLDQIPGDAQRWRDEADRIRRWVETFGWDPERQAYRWYAGGEGLDASILLHAISGFDRGPRMSSTIDALFRELGSGPLLHRYSGMPGQEGAFVACSFWAVAALVEVGRVEEARSLMDELLPLANDVGLFSEMVDPDDGAFLGNLPQGLSHLALLRAVSALEEDASTR